MSNENIGLIILTGGFATHLNTANIEVRKRKTDILSTAFGGLPA